jgi:hypothetical protein
MVQTRERFAGGMGWWQDGTDGTTTDLNLLLTERKETPFIPDHFNIGLETEVTHT